MKVDLNSIKKEEPKTMIKDPYEVTKEKLKK